MLRQLLPLTLATFAVGTDGFIIAGLLPAISDDLSVDLPTAGQLVTVFALTFAISAPVLGAITSGLNRRTALILALALFALGNVVTAIATTYPTALAGRVLAALGAGMISSAASSTAAAMVSSEQRGQALGIVMGGLSAATALGLPLGILVGGANWRLALWGIAGLGIAAAVGVAAMLPKLTLPTSTLMQRLAPVRQLWVLRVLLATISVLAANYFLFTYIGAATQSVTGASVSTLALILSIWGFGVLSGTISAGILCDRFRPKAILLTTLPVNMALLVIGHWAFHNPYAILVWMGLWGICVGLPVVPQQHRLTSGGSTAAPILLGLNSAAVYIGIAVGSALGGISQIWFEPSELGLPAAALLLLPFAILSTSHDKRRPRPRRSKAAQPNDEG